jgi:hypothetical protein
MLREKFHKMLTDEKQRTRLQKALRLLAFMGIMWIFSFPFMAREVFTSENAFNGTYLTTKFDKGQATIEVFNQIKEQVGSLPEKEVFDFVKSYMSHRAETFTQPIKSFGEGKLANVYSYLRSKDGFGGECNIITAPINYKASVTNLLTFVSLMDSH